MPKKKTDSGDVASVALSEPRRKVHPIRPEDLLSTGCTLLNLACTDRSSGGFAKGLYYFLPGDSNSGKTWLMFTCLAEAARNKHFKDYRFVYDRTTEDGAQMDIAYYFGKEVAKRLEWIRSETAEEFYYNMDSILKDGPAIVLCDSENGLRSEQDDDKFQEQKDAFVKGKEVAGSYRMAKPKLHSQNLPRVCAQLRDTGSMLLVSSQTRDNIDPMSPQKRTRSGGRAMGFYASVEIWLSVVRKLHKTVRGKPRQIGSLLKAQIRRTRFTGKERSVQFPIYHSVGIDDVGGCVDYLISEGAWSATKGRVKAPEFEFEGTKEKLIHEIEDTEGELELQTLVADVWREIEEASVVERKTKYR